MYKKRVTGKRRSNLALKLEAYGTYNTLNKLENQGEEIENVQTLKNILYESRHKDMLSANYLIDAIGLYWNEGQCNFVHNIGLNPFGVLMTSENQLLMWDKTKQLNPILYFDATGSINQKITNQSDPFFYSMTFYNRNMKKYIPLFEFVTTDQSQKSISQYLTSSFFSLSEFEKKLKLKTKFFSETIFVTDHSSVLINSILDVYNNCTLSQYLDWSYNILFDKINNLSYCQVMNVIIYICSTHFLNTIRKKTIKITKDNLKLKKAFLFCFGLVQNSTSLKQIELYLFHIYHIFNSRFANNSVINSLDFIRDEIENRNLNDTNCKTLFDINHCIQKQLDENEYFIKCESQNDVKRNSPFRIYFERFFRILKKKHNELTKQNVSFFKKTNKNTRSIEPIKNNYFCPSLLKLIENEMYITPLWTGLMLNFFNEEKAKSEIQNSRPGYTRLTNNPGEGRFNIVKNNILKEERKKKRRVTLSQFTNRLHFDNKSIEKRFFKN